MSASLIVNNWPLLTIYGSALYTYCLLFINDATSSLILASNARIIIGLLLLFIIIFDEVRRLQPSLIAVVYAMNLLPSLINSDCALVIGLAIHELQKDSMKVTDCGGGDRWFDVRTLQF